MWSHVITWHFKYVKHFLPSPEHFRCTAAQPWSLESLTTIPYKQWPAAIMKIARYNTKSWTLENCATIIIHAVVRGVCQLLPRVTNRKERNRSVCKATLQIYGSTTILTKETVRNDSGFGLVPKKTRKLGNLTHKLYGFAKCWFLQASIRAPLHCKKTPGQSIRE